MIYAGHKEQGPRTRPESHVAAICGIGLEVNGRIAGLDGLDSPPRVDARMTLGSLPGAVEPPPSDRRYASAHLDADNRPSLVVTRTPEGEWFHFGYQDGTRIAVRRNGEEIFSTWREPATIEDTATYLLGPTLGFVLRLRGVLALHASAVAIDGSAVAFVGESGAGKSSIAAAFAKRGHPVLSDDLLALADHGKTFDAQPAYPRIRLWGESVAALFGHAQALPLITPTWEKRYLDLRGPQFRFQRNPLPLAAVYILGQRGDEDPAITELQPRDALISLVANTYSNYLLDAPMRAAEFEELTRLVHHVPVRRLRSQAALTGLDRVCQLVIEDFGAHRGELQPCQKPTV